MIEIKIIQKRNKKWEDLEKKICMWNENDCDAAQKTVFFLENSWIEEILNVGMKNIFCGFFDELFMW